MTQITRRGMMAAAATASLAGCAPTIVAPPSRKRGDALANLDATGVAALVRAGEITALEAVDAAITRIEQLNPSLNFMVATDFDRARERASGGTINGPFAGVPFLVKDLHGVIGLRTRSGSRLTEAAPPATAQSALIDTFGRAGLITLGKSATPEYGFLPTTEPVAFGPTRNPWDPTRSSGGSSGGAAVAVASGAVPVAHASDGGGSIRIPAACCGLFGLKPTRGRNNPIDARTPVDLSVSHVVSRSVRDSDGLLAVLERTGAGAATPQVGLVGGPSSRRLRIGLVLNGALGLAPDPAVTRAVEATAALLEEMGHTVVPTDWPMNGPDFSRDFGIYWGLLARPLVAGAVQRVGAEGVGQALEPFTLGLAHAVEAMDPAAVSAAVAHMLAIPPVYEAWFADLDLVLSPVLDRPPVELGWAAGTVEFDELSRRLTAYAGYTPLHNVAGAPAISVPLHWTEGGLPVGSQFAARSGDERTLFQLAYELEAARPWAGRFPPISA